MDGRIPSPGRRALFGESGFCRFPHLNDRLGYLLPREIAQNPDRIGDWANDWEDQANRAKQRFVQTDRAKLVLSPHPDGDRFVTAQGLTINGTELADAEPDRLVLLQGFYQLLGSRVPD